MAGEWKRRLLADVIDLISGGTPKTNVSDYWGGNIPWLSVADFNTGYRWVNTAEKAITDRGLSDSATAMLNRGDIIISARGTVGVVAQLAKPMAFNQSCYGIRGKHGIAESDFVYYALRHAVSEMKQVAHGGVFDTITRDTFKIIKIGLPPLPEQKAIADILGTLDDKIELSRKMNETLEEMAQALFKSWFVDFDPVHAKSKGRQPDGMDAETARLFPSSFQDSEIGRVPKGWKVQSLDATANFLNGLACQKYPPTGDDSLPVIKIAELRNGISATTDRATSSIGADYIIENGDVLFSWSGSLLVKIWTGGKGVLNQHLFKVTSDHFPRWFYYFWVREHLPTFQSIAQDKATTMGHIKRHHLTDARVVVPDPAVLKEADAIIAPLVARCVQCDEESAMLTEARDAMLPRLLSGEITVENAEAMQGGLSQPKP